MVSCGFVDFGFGGLFMVRLCWSLFILLAVAWVFAIWWFRFCLDCVICLVCDLGCLLLV